MSKLTVKVEQFSFPLDKESCQQSEILAEEYAKREEKDDFSEPHELPLPKKFAPTMVAFISGLKIKPATIAETAPPSIENTVTPFRKMIDNVEINTEEFHQLLKFQQKYQIKDLDENLAFYISLKLQGKKSSEMAEILGLKHDFGTLKASTQAKIKKEIADFV